MTAEGSGLSALVAAGAGEDGRRKQAERAGLLLNAIVESSDDAIISKDLNGVITSWNKGAERMFGYTAAEAVGQPITILIPVDRLDEEPKILARLRRGERVDHFETVRQCKNGSLIDISLTISPVKDSRGDIIGASKIARDITDRKSYERRLAEQAHLIDLTGDAILVRDGRDRILEWNRAAREIYGFTREEALGRVSHDLLRTKFPKPLPDILEILLRDGHWSGELSHERHDGSRIVTLSRWVAERDEKGVVMRILESNNDITERVRVQEDLRRANLDLEQFAFSATHDLQEPLRTISIYSELLSKRFSGALDGEAREFMRHVHNGATRMQILLRDLLAYARLTQLDEPDQVADANQALQTAISNLASAITQSNAHITVASLPCLPVHAMHLQQLFQNLIGNAIKYCSPERPPDVHIIAEREDKQWVFAVRDNGIGIAPEYKENIFGLFKRLHTSDEYSGTGIGLAICQRIVDRYHGRIWVESEPGQGSTFRFTLPAEDLAATNGHILIVDDNPADVLLIREAIRGVKVPAVFHVAKNGEEAIRFLDEADADITAPWPSVVLLDINLPRKPGSEILQHLRKSQRCGKAVVVVVSSSDSAKDREEMTKLGANGYFHKPFKYEEFMKLGDLVKDLLGGTGI